MLRWHRALLLLTVKDAKGKNKMQIDPLFRLEMRESFCYNRAIASRGEVLYAHTKRLLLALF